LNFTGKIIKGKIVWNNKTVLVDYIRGIEDGTNISVEITETPNLRTNKQNKLWWAWMKIISKELGYSKNEIHDILKYKFLLREEIIEGETNQYIKSTSTLTKTEFNKLTQDVFYWSNETLNINLPND
tara:strand:+ start:5606 stop:5986 length:381 start_codon:yes stop_codon:yes gene_type:complete